MTLGEPLMMNKQEYRVGQKYKHLTVEQKTIILEYLDQSMNAAEINWIPGASGDTIKTLKQTYVLSFHPA